MDKLTKVVYINLEYREDRKKNITSQFEKINFGKYERFNAIRTNFGGLGCCQSHIAILEKFLDEHKNEPFDNVKNCVIMILEDDAEFIQPRQVIDNYINKFLENESAQGLCLAFYPHILHPYDENFNRIAHVATASCYLVKLSNVKLLLDVFKTSEKGLLTIENENIPNSDPRFRQIYNLFALDQLWRKLHADHLWFTPKNKCVEQYANYSDIEKYVIPCRY